MSMAGRHCCIECQTFMACRENGIFVLETFEDNRPYKIWMADLYECPDCEKQIVSGFGANAVSEHYKEDFQHYMLRVSQTILGCPRGLTKKRD